MKPGFFFFFFLIDGKEVYHLKLILLYIVVVGVVDPVVEFSCLVKENIWCFLYSENHYFPEEDIWENLITWAIMLISTSNLFAGKLVNI